MNVAVQRDLWDWTLLLVSLAAGGTAIFLFFPWALERRRRPEARFQWRISLDGDAANLTVWEPALVPDVEHGQEILVEAAIMNVGDKAGSDTLLNFVTPDVVELTDFNNPTARPLRSTNGIVGIPDDYRVCFFPSQAHPWTPGNWISRQYRLTIAGPSPDTQYVRILLDVGDDAFNDSGTRWRLARPPSQGPDTAPAGTPWPPTQRRPSVLSRAWPRRVTALPRGRVECAQGARRDVRDLRLVPPSQEAATN